MKNIFVLIALVLLFTQCYTAVKKDENISISAIYAGPVEDEETAKKIAEAVWVPIYGKDIYNQKPFVATLKDTVWIVQGSLPEDMAGGVAYIEIQKRDGKVLKVTHGK